MESGPGALLSFKCWRTAINFFLCKILRGIHWVWCSGPPKYPTPSKEQDQLTCSQQPCVSFSDKLKCNSISLKQRQ